MTAARDAVLDKPDLTAEEVDALKRAGFDVGAEMKKALEPPRRRKRIWIQPPRHVAIEIDGMNTGAYAPGKPIGSIDLEVMAELGGWVGADGFVHCPPGVTIERVFAANVRASIRHGWRLDSQTSSEAWLSKEAT